ncbi:MAG TPA: DUF1289 domain-containing protein [Rhizomicrobium sp.]
MIQTPCINICKIDPATRLCEGCGRSLDEIARWGSMSDAERAAIMRALPERRIKPGLPTS